MFHQPATPGPHKSWPHVPPAKREDQPPLTTSTSPLTPSFSTTYQGSLMPLIFALWPKVYRNQPAKESAEARG
jgi:hypothetical protein